MFSVDTIAAIATPPGEGGIAVLRISGSEAVSIGSRLFRPHRGRGLEDAPGYTVRYGRFFQSDGELIDDGLITVFRAPYSYTGEETIEISCHGGRAVTDRMLGALLAAGARLAEPGEFTLRAFLNGRLDLAQAEAVGDLIRARTESARRVARRQLDGGLSRAVNAVRDELIGILASIEVTIDFSDEVGELDYVPLTARIEAAAADVDRLLATAQRGRILREGLQVAIVGRPNVGKSSLLNALLRADRAIVTPFAGTTRDLIEEAAEISGIRTVLVDTAGIRETQDPIEQIGVERALKASSDADVTLLVLDATAPPSVHEMEWIEETLSTATGQVLVAINKSDLADAAVIGPTVELLTARLALRRPPMPVSAHTAEGLEALESGIVESVTSQLPMDAPTDDAVVATARHREALQAAQTSLREAIRSSTAWMPGDFIAIDVRGALEALGQITGDTVGDEVIHRIFRDFCVGK